MAIISIVLILFIAAVLIVGGGTLVYYLIYRHIINKRVAQGITHKKGVMSPIWMPVILVAVMFFLGAPALIAMLLVSGVTYGAVTSTETMEVVESVEISLYTAEEMQDGYLSVYSIEENEGFSKLQEESGGLRFTCFSAEDLQESYHPHYLLYTENIAAYPEGTIFLFEGTLLEDGEPVEGFGQIARLEDMPVCVISGMQDHGEMMFYEYELQLTCTVLKEGSEVHAEAYLMEESELPEECVVETAEAEFILTSEK